MKTMNLVLGMATAGWLVACGGAEQFDESENELIMATAMNNITTTGTHGSGGDYAACTADYTAARARIAIYESFFSDRTWVSVSVENAEPNHLHTMWLKVDGTSPLSGIGAGPATGFQDFDAVQATAGTNEAVGNAFKTDDKGNGWLLVRFDYRLSDGVIPFSDYTGNAADDRGLGTTPFTFRVISHCTDGLAHGLVPGPHEPQFQISL